jgi:iron(III) transport system substrate-binding protein
VFALLALAHARAAEVVVYTSVDDVFARPVAEKFEKDTDITVKLVPDTEETKSTGLLNRLIAEKKRPVADVFLSGDPMRAAVLKSNGIFALRVTAPWLARWAAPAALLAAVLGGIVAGSLPSA